MRAGIILLLALLPLGPVSARSAPDVDVPASFRGIRYPAGQSCERDSDEALTLNHGRVHAYRFGSAILHITRSGGRLEIMIDADADYAAAHGGDRRILRLEQGQSKQDLLLDGRPYRLCTRHPIEAPPVPLP